MFMESWRVWKSGKYRNLEGIEIWRVWKAEGYGEQEGIESCGYLDIWMATVYP